MTWHRTEEEVDKMIENMSNRVKGNYITQGVAFNKTCPRQMAILKNALMHSASFSGLTKEVLALKFNGMNSETISHTKQSVEPNNKNRNLGNFF